jgi:hypothetical protein
VLSDRSIHWSGCHGGAPLGIREGENFKLSNTPCSAVRQFEILALRRRLILGVFIWWNTPERFMH